MEDFRATMETNYLELCAASDKCCLRESKSGCIINVSSVAGKIGGLSLTAYMASKFALEALRERWPGR